MFVPGSVVGTGAGRQKMNESFYFVQLSDTHWGFSGPSINPDSGGTLKKAVAAVNGLDEQPDFVVFTGDLIHLSFLSDDVVVIGRLTA